MRSRETRRIECACNRNRLLQSPISTWPDESSTLASFPQVWFLTPSLRPITEKRPVLLPSALPIIPSRSLLVVIYLVRASVQAALGRLPCRDFLYSRPVRAGPFPEPASRFSNSPPWVSGECLTCAWPVRPLQ